MRRHDCSRHQGAGHDAHHRQVSERLPKWSFFSVLPAGPGQRILPLLPAVSCLGGGVSATNSFKIPSPSLSLQRRPEMRSQDPRAVASPRPSLRPPVPASSPAPPAEQQPPGPPGPRPAPGGAWGTQLETPQSPAPLFPWLNPARGSRRAAVSPVPAGRARGRRRKPKPQHSQPREALWTREQIYNEQFLNRGLLAADNYPTAYLGPSFAEGAIRFNGIPPMLRADTVQS